jgi:hypothetical protein
MPLTAENLAKLSPKDENEAAVYKHTRIIEWIHRLPDPEDACNEPVYPYLDTQATESQPQHYADKLPTCPTSNISKAEKEGKAQTHYHTPLSSRDMHIWRRFQNMRRQDVYAQFHRHGAWLTLQYAEDEKVAMFVGIENEEYGLRIHRQMIWLRDKWLGVDVGLSYHVMEYEERDEGSGEKIQSKEEQTQLKEEEAHLKEKKAHLKQVEELEVEFREIQW